jgi:hypothetical protein
MNFETSLLSVENARQRGVPIQLFSYFHGNHLSDDDFHIYLCSSTDANPKVKPLSAYHLKQIPDTQDTRYDHYKARGEAANFERTYQDFVSHHDDMMGILKIPKAIPLKRDEDSRRFIGTDAKVGGIQNANLGSPLGESKEESDGNDIEGGNAPVGNEEGNLIGDTIGTGDLPVIPTVLRRAPLAIQYGVDYSPPTRRFGHNRYHYKWRRRPESDGVYEYTKSWDPILETWNPESDDQSDLITLSHEPEVESQVEAYAYRLAQAEAEEELQHAYRPRYVPDMRYHVLEGIVGPVSPSHLQSLQGHGPGRLRRGIPGEIWFVPEHLEAVDPFIPPANRYDDEGLLMPGKQSVGAFVGEDSTVTYPSEGDRGRRRVPDRKQPSHIRSKDLQPPRLLR